MTIFLLEASSNTCSVRNASEILKLVKEDGNTIREHQETRDFLVKSIVRDISFKKQEMHYVERELKGLMSLLEFQLDTMPGIDLVTASALIAEIGYVCRFPNANKLARFAGIAPVLMRKEGNKKASREIGYFSINFTIRVKRMSKLLHLHQDRMLILINCYLGLKNG